MKKIFFIAAIFSILNCQFSTLHSQEADAVYKLLRYEWTLNADGTSDYHYRHEVQILRNRALVAYADKGETFVVYNPDLEELTVNEVYTIQKDGTRVNMPQNAFIYQLPSECADCGRFNHLRELAMIHTGMELGCTIVVDYTIHRQYNFLHESIPIQRECPVEKMEVVVNYNHNEMELGYAVDGFQYLNSNDVTRTASINTDDMNRVLRYTFVDVKQAPEEPYMPADIIPTLRLFNGTTEFTPAFDQEPFKGAADVMGQVMNKKGKENIVAARNYVVDNIHMNDIHPSHLGYRHATAAEVWQTGCGTAVDKAVLLAGILNAEGYRASVAGEAGDEVAVMIDTLEYRLSVRSKYSPMTLYGKAKDEVKTIKIKATFDAELDTLEDGFYSFPMPFIHQEGDTDPIIHASELPLVRTTPLQTSACDIQTDITYMLPKGVKLVGKIDRNLSFDGVGSVEIVVKQSGRKLRLIRNMQVEKSLIPVSDYAAYRQLLAAWEQTESLLLRAK